MTQALLNNLNTIIKAGFENTEKPLDSDVKDFAKILDVKSSFVSDNADTSIIENEEVPENIQITDITNQEIESPINTLAEAINETIVEAEAETVVDTVISAGVCEEIIEETSDEGGEEDTEAADTTDTNITNEEPTMYTNTEPLENPAAAVLLHSQITTNKVSTTIQNRNDSEESAAPVRDLAQNYTPKQNENSQQESNLIKFSPREDTVQTQEPQKNSYISSKVIKDLNIESIKTAGSKENSSSGNLMQNETPQEQAVKIMIQSAEGSEPEPTVAHVTEGTKPNAAAQPQNVSAKPLSFSNISSEKIIEQITKQLGTIHNNSKVNIVLNPGSLGRINLQLVNSKDGLTAQFTVATRETGDLLTKGLDGLKESLLAQGVNVDNVSIKFEEAGESDLKQDWTEQEGSKNGNKYRGSKRQKEEKPFEQTMSDIENNDKV